LNLERRTIPGHRIDRTVKGRMDDIRYDPDGKKEAHLFLDVLMDNATGNGKIERGSSC
jgi:hypothetical protein